ncbi:dicarboxylate transporter/tellurite-resistance protein TehA [Aliirhizobium terrae]|uniref:dicarboxylate transporter/tellurite-resistance protein TehA n=1 Tax=Terrirhizobium terrae TaxID=2926709 RepID=UPI00257752E6|nr:dicarboxylate transporter/tellurite-resistance protein TehA [Rhizobium sp. CC-CFT758]WJH41890.1 dicarboxylate transporter/tellurite-resistance protein TehA [Rhizobium sp. CC-CFT758]
MVSDSSSQPASASVGMRLPVVPAAAFGLVLGVVGLSGSWRAATAYWGVSAVVGEVIGMIGAAIWLLLVLCYALKWIVFRQDAVQELEHPVQCCFVGLVGVATMLVANVMLPSSYVLAAIVFWLGFSWTALFALWRTGALWRGGRDPSTTTAVLYLPTVAGSYVTGIVGSALGYQGLSQLAFGAGFFSWLAIESVLLNRLLTAGEMNEPIRPTMGIQLAPPTVGTVAYLSATTGMPDMLAHAMLGYGLLQALLMIRILPWLLKQPFTAGYWAFSFGLTALATAVVRMSERGDAGLVPALAVPVFVIVNALIALLVVMTLGLLLRGKLFPLRPVGG